MNYINIPLTPGDREIFVDPVNGSDANTGLYPRFAKKTLQDAMTLIRPGRGDRLRLRRGRTFIGQSFNNNGGRWTISGHSLGRPVMIMSYGNPALPRPKILVGKNDFGICADLGVKNLVISEIELIAENPGENLQFGICAYDGTENLRIEDCLITGFNLGICIQGIKKDRPFIQNVVINRNVICDNYTKSPIGQPAKAQGLYIERVNKLSLIENIIDRNGWNPGQSEKSILNHNCYIATENTDVYVANNYFTRASSHGVQLRCGGIITNNVFLENPIDCLLGGGDPNAFTANGVSGTVFNNLMMYGNDIETAPRGIAIELANIGDAGAKVEANLILHSKSVQPDCVIKLSNSSYGAGVGVNNSTIKYNMIYNRNASFYSEPRTSIQPRVISNSFAKNTIISTDSLHIYDEAGNIEYALNQYSAARFNAYRRDNRDYSFDEWSTIEKNPSIRENNFKNPNLSPVDYLNQAIPRRKVWSTMEEFYNLLRAQRKNRWRDELATTSLYNFIAQGFN